MDKQQTQTQQVLHYLRNNPNGMTSMKAFQLYDVTRLSAIIFGLRKRGIRITTIMEKSEKAGKRSKPYARYVLEDK